MITGTIEQIYFTEYRFELPLNARELTDAIYLVNKSLGQYLNRSNTDDAYSVKSDGEMLIFYWKAP